MRDQVAGFSRLPIIVADVGASHDGDVEKARDLVRAAAEAGADVAKFQLGLSELAAPTSPLHNAFRALALDDKDWERVRVECAGLGIRWTASVWSRASADYLARTPAPFVKVGSGDLTYGPAMDRAASTAKPLVLSTGMATDEEIHDAVEAWNMAPLPRPMERPELVLLACTVDYPTALENAHVSRMQTLKALSLTRHVGYSSHCPDWRVPAYAARMGACMVEAHLGFDKPTDGALDPEDFGLFVAVARGVVTPDWDDAFEKTAWGAPELGVIDCEKEWLRVARRNPATGMRD